MAKTVKRVVKHGKLYRRVEGKLKRLPVGTEIEVTEEYAAKHSAKLADPAQLQRIDVDGNAHDGPEKANPADVEAAIAEMQKKLEASQAESAAANAELQKKLEASQAESAELQKQLALAAGNGKDKKAGK